MNTDNHNEQLALLESDEFDSFLNSVEMMSKARGDLFHLEKAIYELKSIVNEESSVFPNIDETIMEDIIDSMQGLVLSLSESGD